MKWERGIVTVAKQVSSLVKTGGGWRYPRRGYISPQGLFGVHRREGSKLWRITHLATGYTLAGDITDSRLLARAKAIAEMLEEKPHLWEGGELGKPAKWSKRESKFRLEYLRYCVVSVDTEVAA